MGIIYFDEQNASYKSVFCQSDRPSKIVAEFPILSEDILQCPANFAALNDSTTDFSQKLAEEANISPVSVREVGARNAIGTFTRAE